MNKKYAISLHPLNILHPSMFFIVLYIFYLCVYPFFIRPLTKVAFFEIDFYTYIVILLYLIAFSAGTITVYFTINQRFPVYIGRLLNDLYYWRKNFYIFYFVGVVFFLFFYLKAGKIPIFSPDIETARVELKKGIGKYVILGTAFLNISLIFRFVLEYYYRKKTSVLSYVYLFIASMLLLGVGYRGPVAYLILSIILSTTFVTEKYRKSRRINKKLVIIGIITILILSVVGYYRHTKTIDISALASFLWVMAVNVFNLNIILDNIPNPYPYFYGLTFVNDIGAVFHFHEKGFTGVYLKNLFNLTFRGEGMTVTAPGEAYINWGIPGVLLHGFLLGYFSSFLYIWLIRRKKLSSIMLLSIFSINFPRIVVSGIIPTLFFSLGPQFFISFIYVMLSKKRIERLEQ